MPSRDRRDDVWEGQSGSVRSCTLLVRLTAPLLAGRACGRWPSWLLWSPAPTMAGCCTPATQCWEVRELHLTSLRLGPLPWGLAFPGNAPDEHGWLRVLGGRVA